MKVIATVTNNIATDQRLHKVGSTLTTNGYDFLLIGSTMRGKPTLNLPFGSKRINVFFEKGFFFYAEFNLKLLFELIFQPKRNTVLLANDLDTLLPMFIVHKLYRIPLIYDSHEIFSELPSLEKGSIQKKIWEKLEAFLVPRVQNFYTVSRGYANWFQSKYEVNPKIIRNVPLRYLNKHNRKETHPKPYLIYQGAINDFRGIDTMIKAMQFIADYDLIIVGEGPMLESYKQLSKDLKVEEKVYFLGRLNPTDLRLWTQNAFCGLSLEIAKSLSYQLALPNKMFDYIQANIPVIVTNQLPEVSDIVKQYNIGVVINPKEPKRLAEALDVIKENKKIYIDQTKIAADSLCWENQEEELLSIFSTAIQHK